MSVRKHTDLQSLPVENPYPEMPVLHSPDSLVDRHSSVRRKLPTPPLTDPREVDEHVRKTVERLRTQKAFRRHLGGAQNVESDSDLSVMGVQNVVSSVIPSGAVSVPVVFVTLSLIQPNNDLRLTAHSTLLTVH